MNQCLNPLKLETGSNLVDMGRAAVHVSRSLMRVDDSEAGSQCRPGGPGEGLRRTWGEAAAEKLGADPVNRHTVNTGTVRGRPTRCPAGAGAGRPAVG